MDLTEKEIIYSTDDRFDLIKELCHLSKNLYNASLYDVIKCFKIYEVEHPKLKKDNARYFSIDLGLNNIVSIYNNIGIRPLLYNGRPIKSINQYYNKTNARLHSELPANLRSSKRLRQLSFKRNNKIDYEMHKISSHIINEAVKNNISKIFIGKNVGWKTEINIGRRNTQNFVNIPHTKLISQLLYKGLLNGIKVIVTEESYTSKTSFFDKDQLPIYGESENHKFSGKRIKRGLYRDSKGNLWNADLNGAGNIMRKCSDKAYKNINKTKELMKQPILVTL